MSTPNQELQGNGCCCFVDLPVRLHSPVSILVPPPNTVGDLEASSLMSLPPGNGCKVLANQDMSELPPETALKMLCTHMDGLAKLTGDIPSTPLGRIIPFRVRNGDA